jgi:ketosteroid isomerase-like protein
MDTRQVIDKYYESVNTGDWDTWMSLFDDSVVMDEQLGGHVEGTSTLKGVVEAIQRGYSKFQMHPEHIVVQGDEAGVFWHCEAANASGVPIDAYGANYFRVQGGKVVYERTIHDTVPFKPFTDQKLD